MEHGVWSGILHTPYSILHSLLLAGALAACASQGAPPGGPPDAQAPRLLQVVPDTGAVNVAPPRVVFRFDEVVAERPQSVPTLAALFLVSPRDGEPEVGWDREVVTVRPRRGFRKNTVYMVTMLPGIVDLRGNVRRDGASVVFSTGPSIPATRVSGLAFDWPTGAPLARGFVEARPMTDTTTTYVTYADSSGRFTLEHLPAGSYRVRAYSDANANRALEPRESWDTVTVSVAEARDSAAAAPRLELLAFVHDTTGPRLQTVTPGDSLTLRVEFDEPLLPSAALSAASFRLQRADSSVIAIVAAEAGREADARAAARRQAADTLGRADSLERARRADSTRVANQGRRALPPNIKATAPDTSRSDVPKPSRPSPQKVWQLTLGAPLAPGETYRLTVTDARNLQGYAATSTRAFTTPKAAAPADTTRRQAPGAADAKRPLPPATPPARDAGQVLPKPPRRP